MRRGIAAKQELEKICENMMDNCLASNSETGGVGCDNMTMLIIGILNGKTKDEWYEEIARRVANGDGPCAPPEYGTTPLPPLLPFWGWYLARTFLADQRLLVSSPAEFRGPGVHHNYEDSDSGYEMDAENKGKGFGVGGYRGRIIFLGDGTEVLTDSDDTEMFDNADEDKDLESQVSQHSPSTEKDDASSTKATAPAATETKPDLESAQSKAGEGAAPAKQEGVKQEKSESSGEHKG